MLTNSYLCRHCVENEGDEDTVLVQYSRVWLAPMGLHNKDSDPTRRIGAELKPFRNETHETR